MLSLTIQLLYRTTVLAREAYCLQLVELLSVAWSMMTNVHLLLPLTPSSTTCLVSQNMFCINWLVCANLYIKLLRIERMTDDGQADKYHMSSEMSIIHVNQTLYCATSQ